jgi:hypothetical protein
MIRRNYNKNKYGAVVAKTGYLLAILQDDFSNSTSKAKESHLIFGLTQLFTTGLVIYCCVVNHTKFHHFSFHWSGIWG